MGRFAAIAGLIRSGIASWVGGAKGGHLSQNSSPIICGVSAEVVDTASLKTDSNVKCVMARKTHGNVRRFLNSWTGPKSLYHSS